MFLALCTISGSFDTKFSEVWFWDKGVQLDSTEFIQLLIGVRSVSYNLEQTVQLYANQMIAYVHWMQIFIFPFVKLQLLRNNPWLHISAGNQNNFADFKSVIIQNLKIWNI